MSTAVESPQACTTPILDRLAPLPQPAQPGPSLGSSRASSIVLGIATGLGVILWHLPLLSPLRESLYFRSGSLFHGTWTATRVLSALASLFVVLLVATVIHEVGHMLGGMSAGFRFSQLRIGPLQIDHPFRVSFQRIPGTYYCAWVRMVPVKKDNLLKRATVLVLAGPGINLLCGGAVLVLPFSKGFLSELFTLVSLASGVVNLVPLRTRTAISDGRRLWLLFRNPPWSRRSLALMRLQGDLREGILPESLPADYLADAIAYLDDAPDTVVAYGLAYAAAFHQRRDTEAGQFLETCLRCSSGVAPFMREAIMSDAGVFQARRRGRDDLAEQWLALMPQPTHNQWLRSRVEAGICEARGDWEGALRKIDDVEGAMLAMPDQAVCKMFLPLLERWKSELRAQVPSTNAHDHCD